MEIPIGTSTSPPRLILPAIAKTLVPLLFAVPRLLNACAPFSTIQGTLAKVSTLLMLVGQSHRPLTAGKGGRTRGMPRLPSIEAMRAVSSPQTKAPAPSLSLTWKLESGAEDVVAQEAVRLGLRDGDVQPLDRQRVLGAHVDVALRGADGVAGDDHALQHRVRIALQDRAVHEGAGVALVGVADDVLLRRPAPAA